MSASEYIPTIGVETHVQLNTKTKLFAAVDNDARKAPPNTLISHICVGMPGALPVLNQRAVDLAIVAAFALGTEPEPFSKFDRKHYFYPDLPKGYQITQYEQPIITSGFVEIEVDGEKKKIGITRVNLEEDAGKNIHPPGADYSLVDLNRAGTPLLEIVSEPEIHSPIEAKAYVRELYLLMKYAQVSDVDLYHGHMRFDVNVSVSKNPNKPGTRSEIKNLNSFRYVEAVAAFEIDRQIALLEKGEPVVQETRGWDEAKQKTTTQRRKEEAHDYRYMPEPDIPPIQLGPDKISQLKSELPELPASIRQKLSRLDIQSEVIEDILDQSWVVGQILQTLDEAKPESARRLVFWLIHTSPSAETSPDKKLRVQPQRVIQLSDMVEKNELSSSSAQKVFGEMIKSDEEPEKIAKRLNLLQVSDAAEIEKIVAQVISENPRVVEDIKNGQTKAISFLVGQVMKKSQGKANPAIAQQIIRKQLKL